MSEIGLIDVDGHNFPNLALMRISAYHKSLGDNVEWVTHGFKHYDKIYISKIFSDAYTRDTDMFLNADEVYRGGTGYAIELRDKYELYHEELDPKLPSCIESLRPDYSIYPQYDFAVAMTSRGCPNQCAFCHVSDKEGVKSVKVADVEDFYNGQKRIEVIDPNLTACADKRNLFRQYREIGCEISFNQGLDIRRLDDDDIEDLNNMKLHDLHFAWDSPHQNLVPQFENFVKKYTGKKIDGHGHVATAMMLVNWNSTIEEDLYRIKKLNELHIDPYVMIYNKPNAPSILKHLQRWCNNKFIFNTTENFWDYENGTKR